MFAEAVNSMIIVNSVFALQKPLLSELLGKFRETITRFGKPLKCPKTSCSKVLQQKKKTSENIKKIALKCTLATFLSSHL